MSQQLPETAAVVVVGAGLSGLVAAHELMKAGVEDIVVVEAQDRPGGRIRTFTRPDGGTLEMAAELTGPIQPTMLALAAELGVEVDPVGAPKDPENPGRMVVLVGGQPMEGDPFAGDQEAGAAIGAAVETLEALLREVDGNAPWTAERAFEFDSLTTSAWLEANVAHPGARMAVGAMIGAAGPIEEVSFLHTLAHLSRHGGVGKDLDGLGFRFRGGTSAMLGLIADVLGDRLVLSAPVRRIARDDDGVTIDTDRGAIRAKAVIVAAEPNVARGIEFDPPLPADRAKLQERWVANPGAKVVAVYESPFWIEEGYAGLAVGGAFVDLADDFSLVEGPEAYAVGMVFFNRENAATKTAILADPARARAAAIEDLVAYYGPKARDVKELHLFDWFGNRWSGGAGGFQLGPGLLTGFGRTLRAPVGPIFWAGEGSGTGDYMESAASAGEAAAKEAAALVR
jgi:monoamine oxidase